MPYIAPYRSQLRPYNHAYAYRGLTAFATLSMAVSVGTFFKMSARPLQQPLLRAACTITSLPLRIAFSVALTVESFMPSPSMTVIS
ncbi:MAG: hypothetical protein ABW170_23290 [Candidatus Thiodiazotropha sp. L084R]